MHLPKAHAESDLPTLHALIHQNPLGILTTALKSSVPEHSFIQSSHIPWVLDTDTSSPGVLRGHMARQNPQAKVLMETLANAGKDPNGGELDEEVLVLFNGPHHHYVTPKFYTATKPATGKVVPTWNYSAVQAYGRVRVFCDSKGEGSGSYLQKQIEDLTKLNEGLMGYGEKGTEKARWEVDDAPGNYIDIMKKNIIGVEIHVERLEGKFKMSQEMGTGDREGVVNGFEELGTDVGLGMAKTVKERGELKDQAARK